MHLRSAAQAVRATLALHGRGLGRTVSNVDVAMIQWEHHQRLGQALRRRESGTYTSLIRNTHPPRITRGSFGEGPMVMERESGMEKDTGVERESWLQRQRSFRSYLMTKE